MKGKKLAFAVILALIVCLVLIPVSAYADDEPTGDPVVTSDPVPPTTTSTTPVPPTTTSTTPVPPTTTSTTPVPPTTTSTTPVPPTTTSTTLVPPTTGTPVVTSDPSSVENAGDRDTVEKAADNATAGTEHIINITNDIDLDAVPDPDEKQFIEIGKTGLGDGVAVIIDLGGHTIKRAGGKTAFAFYGNGNYTLRNGTIVGSVNSYDNVNLTLAKGLLCKDTVQACNDSTVHIYGKIEKDVAHKAKDNTAPVCTQGSTGYTGGSFVVYEGAEIINGLGDVAVYLPSGSMTVEGGTITGGTGIYIKSSSLTLNGGTINATGAKQNYVYNGNGCQNTGDAIVAEYSSTAYGDLDMVTINGGNISSKNGNAFAKYVYAGTTQTKLDNTAVTGGVFSDDSALEYVNKDNTVIAKSNGNIAVGESVLELAKPGATVELVNLPDEYNNGTIDLPGGVTIVNSTDKDITMNGITLKPGESFTVPYSFAYTESYSKYFVVDGEEQEWTKGSADGLTFKLNSEDVIKVLIDGVEVEFTVENGEIVISAEVLKALEAGEHEIEFVFADGSCKTVFTVK